MLPSLTNMPTADGPHDASDVGVIGPIPTDLDAAIYALEERAAPLVHVGVRAWHEPERGFRVTLMGTTTRADALDLAAYILSHFIARYDFPRPEGLFPEPALETAIGPDFEMYPHHQRFTLRQPTHPDPPGITNAQPLMNREIGLVGRPYFVVSWPTPTVDRRRWQVISGVLQPDANGMTLQEGLIEGFLEKARSLTDVIVAWVRDVYAPRVGLLGAVRTTNWSWERRYTQDDVQIGVDADMPVFNQRSLNARRAAARS